MASRRASWRTAVPCALLLSLAGDAEELDRFRGAWVGGIELGGDFVSFALRVDEGVVPGSLVTRAQRLDGMAPPVPTSSTEIVGDELRVGFDRGGITWSLHLMGSQDGLAGDFVTGGRSFEASFVRMVVLEAPELERLAGAFERDGGSRLRLDPMPGGFLRACFVDEGRFQYLFPDAASALFAGPSFERASPKVQEVTFLDDGSELEWVGSEPEPWRARRIEPEPLALSLEGLTITGPNLSLPLVRVEPGEFEMGQRLPSGEVKTILGLPEGPLPEVDPLRPTRITRPVLLAAVELSNEWFDAFVRETGHMTDAERLGSGLVWTGASMEPDPGASWRDPRVETSRDAPAVMVSWNDAVAFCSWLGDALGREVRLPTEAEWEYACRAGTETMFWWGDDPTALDAHAWGHSNATGPRPVGALRPNPWGLHDMHGNVWEWCADFFAAVPPDPAVDPRGPADGTTRVLRGGSWINGPWQQRAEFRAGEPAGLAEPHIGFRIVVELQGASQGEADVEERVRRVESGLLPPVRIRGRDSAMKLVERMAHYRVPGLGLAVLEGGEVAWARSYGVTDVVSGEPVTPDTLFQAGSISKPVAALAALCLVEQGALDLDEDVNARLVTWKVPENDLTRESKVTLRRLLSHGAGLSVHGFPGYAVDAALPSLVQVLDGAEPANTAAIVVESPPGAIWRYSGGGYTVLQQLLVDVTERPFPEVMREIVLAPAGMSRSTYENRLPPSLLDAAAAGHRRNGERVEGRWHVYPEMAAAGLWTTPTDLARWVLEVQRALEGRSQILSRATAWQMVTVQQGDHGLGPSLEHAGETSARFGHGGVNEGFEAFFTAYCKGGRGAVVMTNANGAMPLAQELVRAVAREYGWPDYLPEERVLADVAEEVYRRRAGLYETERDAEVRLTVVGGRLWAQGLGPMLELLPESEVRFFSESGLVVSFELDEDGAVVGALFEQHGRATRASKVE